MSLARVLLARSRATRARAPLFFFAGSTATIARAMSSTTFSGVYKFTATWCGPCQTIKEALRNAIVEALGDASYLQEIDVDQEESSELTTRYGVTAMPTMVFVINGVEQKQLRVECANMRAVVRSLQTFASCVPNQNSLPASDDAIVPCQPTHRRKKPK